jgi:hypothetical protein
MSAQHNNYPIVVGSFKELSMHPNQNERRFETRESSLLRY